MQNRNKMQVTEFLVGMHMYYTLFMQHITRVSSAAAVFCTCGYLTAEKSRYPPLRLLSHPHFSLSHASHNFSGQYWPQDRVFNNSGRKICTSYFSFQTFYICMKSESRVSLIRREGVLCDMFCWGTKHYCSFLSFVRIYRVSQMNNLKNCNYSIIYVKRINLSKQIGMYKATLCEGITSFYWETSRRDLELLVFVRIAGFEKRKSDLELHYMCFLYFSH